MIVAGFFLSFFGNKFVNAVIFMVSSFALIILGSLLFINLALEKVEEDEVKSGDYVRVMITAKGFKVDGNSGVTFYMGNVLFVKEGEALAGGATDPNTDFDDDDDSEEAEDISIDDDDMI